MRMLRLDLPYAPMDLEEVQIGQIQGRTVPVGVTTLLPSALTVRLITFAVHQACPGGMDKATAGIWLGIKRLLTVQSNGSVQFSDEQYAFLASAVNSCRYAVAAVEAASLLWAELLIIAIGESKKNCRRRIWFIFLAGM